jgi:hypothetical protein
MSLGSPQARELAARESGGIHVLLLWHPDENALTVSVQDAPCRRSLPPRGRA